MPLVIAIDGPAAAGKGTLARRLAGELGLPYLDTGLLYRAVARRLLTEGATPTDSPAAEYIARSLQKSDLDRDDLRTPAVDRAAAQVASLPDVRRALLSMQRDFATRNGGVLDGRDIGTVIFPDADIKLFVTASAEARAQRRWQELIARGVPAEYQTVLSEIEARDRADAEREAAPLKIAADAVVIDTTALNPDAAFTAALEAIRARLATEGAL